jgi:hypothetical protein
LHGVVFDILVGSEHRERLAAVFGAAASIGEVRPSRENGFGVS